jgi:hypothetical protein
MGCLPGQISGENPFAQDKSNFNPDLPLLNVNAFEPASRFTEFQDMYAGVGPRVSDLRGFGFHNQDVTLTKAFKIREGMNFQVRGDFFNIYNMHSLRGFDTDIASPTFGVWNGGVTAPRYIQLGGRFQF